MQVIIDNVKSGLRLGTVLSCCQHLHSIPVVRASIILLAFIRKQPV